MGHAYGFFWRCRAINDIAHLTSYRDAIGVPCIRAQPFILNEHNNVSVTKKGIFHFRCQLSQRLIARPERSINGEVSPTYLTVY